MVANLIVEMSGEVGREVGADGFFCSSLDLENLLYEFRNLEVMSTGRTLSKLHPVHAKKVERNANLEKKQL